MKIAKLILGGILLLYCQILLAPKFSLLGVIPNFLIAYIIYVNINKGMQTSLTISFFCGLIFDLVQPNLLGLHSLAFIIFSMIIQNFHSTINKKRLVVVTCSIFLLNIIYFIIFIFYHFLSMQKLSGIYPLSLFSISYNTFWTVCLIYTFLIMSRIKLVIDV